MVNTQTVWKVEHEDFDCPGFIFVGDNAEAAAEAYARGIAEFEGSRYRKPYPYSQVSSATVAEASQFRRVYYIIADKAAQLEEFSKEEELLRRIFGVDADEPRPEWTVDDVQSMVIDCFNDQGAEKPNHLSAVTEEAQVVTDTYGRRIVAGTDKDAVFALYQEIMAS
jgi:hypothetical protein